MGPDCIFSMLWSPPEWCPPLPSRIFPQIQVFGCVTNLWSLPTLGNPLKGTTLEHQFPWSCSAAQEEGLCWESSSNRRDGACVLVAVASCWSWRPVGILVVDSHIIRKVNPGNPIFPFYQAQRISPHLEPLHPWPPLPLHSLIVIGGEKKFSGVAASKWRCGGWHTRVTSKASWCPDLSRLCRRQVFWSVSPHAGKQRCHCFFSSARIVSRVFFFIIRQRLVRNCESSPVITDVKSFSSQWWGETAGWEIQLQSDMQPRTYPWRVELTAEYCPARLPEKSALYLMLWILALSSETGYKREGRIPLGSLLGTARAATCYSREEKEKGVGYRL